MTAQTTNMTGNNSRSKSSSQKNPPAGLSASQHAPPSNNSSGDKRDYGPSVIRRNNNTTTSKYATRSKGNPDVSRDQQVIADCMEDTEKIPSAALSPTAPPITTQDTSNATRP